MTKRKKKNFSAAAPVKIVEPKINAPVALAEVFNSPAVSVVIPMYNAEKYIAACLESLLEQSFKNFDIIVVDDGSTDNSPAIVDSFISKFGGRLNRFRLKTNSGGANIPRNTGINLARGEYIHFMDSDDCAIKTALEEDFTLAKEYNAEVVYHTLFYNLSADGSESKLAAVPKYRPNDKIVLDEDLTTRVKDLARNRYYHNPWRSFSRRDFLIANELYFPNINAYADIVWNYALLIYAKRFLRVPSAVYFYRYNENSLLRKKRTSAQNAKFSLSPIIRGLKNLDTFISRNEFFDKEPQLHYALLESYCNGQFQQLLRGISELSPFTLYETLKEEFNSDLDEYDVLVPALCSALAQQQKITAMNMNQFKEYAAQAEQKILALENEVNQRKNKQ